MKKSLVALLLFLITAAFVVPSVAKDKTLTCTNCGGKFTFTTAEQSYNKKNKLPAPTICPKCQKKPDNRIEKKGRDTDNPDTRRTKTRVIR